MGIFLVAIFVLGEIALLLDLGGRLFGTYSRTPLRAGLRITVVVAASIAVALPAFYSFAFEETARPWGLGISAGLGILLSLHFLFPFHFGIRRTAGGRMTKLEPLLPGVHLRTETFAGPVVPESADGFKCLVLSDFHCNSERKLKLIRQMVDKLQDERADCVFLLGDFGEDKGLLPDVLTALAKIPARHGTFLVRSNHDFEGGREQIVNRVAEQCSMSVLANETIAFHELGMCLIGLEYPWNIQGNPEVSKSTFAVGLTHTPDNLTQFACLGVPLSVAGHTHGGKIRLPWIGALLVPSKFGRLLDQGWFTKGGCDIFVTKGIGYFPGKLGNQGEVLRLVLRRIERG